MRTKKTHEDWRLWDVFVKGLMNQGKFQLIEWDEVFTDPFISIIDWTRCISCLLSLQKDVGNNQQLTKGALRN